ncbi:MarR family winged helix-turn-helix transcriptional regulator [Neisseria perflava]|uniref:MarR family winged helix-turn-helix transcriptional regulator n=1 Tax=Neisseria perflava TaxID=33053 RepID=UPI0020A1E7A1|nr:MarR family transcriptional regulator [Neisseria perflava]MCP1661130.1 DNA-binding MarR family transcriptional regulator [Neisseria perflava]MCP1773095.1 DNA-binding MarR family transcriptional regulator [Neisseria perflava]
MHQMDEIGRLMAQILTLYEQWAKQQGLNYNTLAVLYVLATEGRRTQKQIGESWHLPKQTVFSICRQLKEQGYVDFAQDNPDKREKSVFLTDSGQAYAQPFAEKMRALENAAFARFGVREAQQLITELRRLADLLNEAMSSAGTEV